MFHLSFIESIFFICRDGSVSLNNRNRLDCVVKVCNRIAGITPNDLPNLYPCRVVNKATSILYEQSLPLFKKFRLLLYSHRYGLLTCMTSKLRDFCALLSLAFLATQAEFFFFAWSDVSDGSV